MILWDEAGIPYEVDLAEFRKLIDKDDPVTVAQPKTDRDLSYLDPLDQRSGIAPAQYLTPTEAQLRTFLTGTVIPDHLRRYYWAISYTLAISKITSEDDYERIRLEIDNILRIASLSGDNISLSDAEQLALYADTELRRSRTYDGTPHERYLWVYRDVRQSGNGQIDDPALAPVQPPRRGGVLGMVFGGRR
jgi:hypothetical protein